MAKKCGVGLVVLTEIPEHGRMAILQLRGSFNPEKMGAESWPGGCQVTVHGGLEGDEGFEEALKREIAEELGDEACRFIQEHGSSPKLVSKLETEQKVMATYAVLCHPEILKLIRWHAGSGGMCLIRREDVDQIQDLSSLDKKEGVLDPRVVAMFPDEKEAVKAAFEKFADWKFAS